jgi:hypothetical protein
MPHKVVVDFAVNVIVKVDPELIVFELPMEVVNGVTAA